MQKEKIAENGNPISEQQAQAILDEFARHQAGERRQRMETFNQKITALSTEMNCLLQPVVIIAGIEVPAQAYLESIGLEVQISIGIVCRS